MTQKSFVELASRALAVLFIVWALTDVSYQPARLYEFLHYFGIAPSSAYFEYMRHLELIELGFLVTRIVGFSAFFDAALQVRARYSRTSPSAI